MKLINENTKLIIGFLLIGLSISLYYNFKPYEKDTVFIEVPAKEGSKVIDKPKPLPQKSSKEYIQITKTDTIKVENEVNVKLLKEMKDLIALKGKVDSLTFYKNLYNKYLKSIEINRYNEKFEDEYVRGEVNTEVTGTLNNQTINWESKERKIEVEVPKRKPMFFVGGEIQYQYEKHQPNFVGSVSLLTPKSTLYTIGVSTNKEIHVGLSTTLTKKQK